MRCRGRSCATLVFDLNAASQFGSPQRGLSCLRSVKRKVGAMRPTLVTNPVTDRNFSAFAEKQLEAGPSTIGEFQARLRVPYPHAVVHARELAAEPSVIW